MVPRQRERTTTNSYTLWKGGEKKERKNVLVYWGLTPQQQRKKERIGWMDGRADGRPDGRIDLTKRIYRSIQLLDADGKCRKVTLRLRGVASVLEDSGDEYI